MIEMKRIVVSGIASLLFVFVCTLIGAFLTGLFVPIESSTDTDISNWHAANTTMVFVLILSSYTQRALRHISDGFHKIERWFIGALAAYFVCSGIDAYFLLSGALFAVGWIIIRYIIARRDPKETL